MSVSVKSRARQRVIGWADRFRTFAYGVARHVGSPWAFGVAMALVVAWALAGPYFGFSDTWQLVINTGTTILTFLMVFVIQSTQNRDATAVHLKLDELIRGVKGARTRLVHLEDCSEEELRELERQFEALRHRHTPSTPAKRKPTNGRG